MKLYTHCLLDTSSQGLISSPVATSSVAVSSTATSDGSNLPATYSYDPTSGFYYDSSTGLYYDPKTQVIIKCM